MAAIRALALPSAWLALTMTETSAWTGSAVSNSLVAATAARIFADLADPQEVNSARDDAWKTLLWQALSDAGLTLAWVPEEQGGAGAELSDGFAVLGVAGRAALAIPLASNFSRRP